jgi:cytochrome c biogenesis factor
VIINIFFGCLFGINTFILLFFTNFFLVKNSPYTNVLDLYARIHLNQGYISLFHFFWTSFWYLPATYLTLIAFTYYFLGTKLLSRAGTLTISTILILNYLEFSEYFFLNLSSIHVIMRSELVNNLLTNSINKYHPLLFYIATIQLFKPFNITYKSVSLPKAETVTIVFTLALGSWWASQEGSWGGWWNWDPSEVFGLVVMLSLVLLSHRSLRSLRTYTSIFSRISTSLLTFFVYFFIQVNFDIVSHNFGTKIDTYVSTLNFLLLLSLCIYILSIKTYLVVNRRFTTNLILFPTFLYARTVSNSSRFVKLTQVLPKTYVSFLVLALVASSFSLLVNDFLWKFLAVNAVNYFIDYTVVVVLITLVIFFILWDVHYASLAMYFALYLQQPYLLILLPLIKCRFNRTTLAHLTILLSFLVNLTLVPKTVTHWSPLWESFTFRLLDLPSHQNIAVSLNQLNLGISPKNLMQSHFTEYPYSFLSVGSSNETHMFTHIVTLSTFVQELFVGSTLARSSVKVVNFDLNVIIALVLSSLAYLVSTFFTKKVIVF